MGFLFNLSPVNNAHPLSWTYVGGIFNEISFQGLLNGSASQDYPTSRSAWSKWTGLWKVAFNLIYSATSDMHVVRSREFSIYWFNWKNSIRLFLSPGVSTYFPHLTISASLKKKKSQWLKHFNSQIYHVFAHDFKGKEFSSDFPINICKWQYLHV